MESKEQFIRLCVKGMRAKGVFDDPVYKDRLASEMWEIDGQGEYDYYLDLHRKGIKFSHNENNVLAVWLLDLVPDFEISKDCVWVTGEFPDVDVDYLPEVREYIRNEYLPKLFGNAMVVAVGTLGTFGIKGAVTDIARIFGLDHMEVKIVTKEIEDKDEEGKPINWETAIRLFPLFKAYCEAHPEVADAAHRLLNRNRSLGKHAGGLIIANQRLDNIIPMMRNSEERQMVSAYSEGLHGTDLGPLGLVKFDFLSLLDLVRTVNAVRLVKERHNLRALWALPDGPTWSDTSYLEDPKALEMANEADLKCIFQFGSPGIRKLVKQGGVNCFNDLVAYSALYRPGPLGMKMHEVFVRRKRGEEDYELHPLMQPYLAYTYGVMAFQEQVLQILTYVGGVPKSLAEKIRKAISKKKVKEFIGHKESSVKNFVSRLSYDEEKSKNLWDQIESFSEYGFNRSHSVSYTVVSQRLLCLKAHYPLEFYTSTLQIEDDTDKVKEYKLEAERHGIVVNKIDLNKSDWTYAIRDEQIYIGFGNIKGVGEAIAKRVVEHQPYTSFEDFLKRFGCDSKVLKPLIGLGAFDQFGETDHCKLWEFAEHYKSVNKGRKDRDERAITSRAKIVDDLCELISEGVESGEGILIQSQMPSTDLCDNLEDFLRTVCETCSDEKAFITAMCGDLGKKLPLGIDPKKVWKLAKKYQKNIETLKKKQELDGEVGLAAFQRTNDMDEELAKIYSDISSMAERQWYGFGWRHLLEHSPDYDGGKTLSQFEDENLAVVQCEVMVAKPLEKKMSKNNNNYYVLRVEDSNFQQVSVNIWEDDFRRFQEEFMFWDSNRGCGHMMKIRLERPSGGFPTYKFDCPPKMMRHKKIPKDKNQDYRLILMKSPYADDQAAEASLGRLTNYPKEWLDEWKDKSRLNESTPKLQEV